MLRMWLPESRSLIIAYILTLVALFCFISFLMNALNLRTFCFQIYFMRNRIQFYLNDRKTFNVWILNIYFLLSRCVLVGFVLVSHLPFFFVQSSNSWLFHWETKATRTLASGSCEFLDSIRFFFISWQQWPNCFVSTNGLIKWIVSLVKPFFGFITRCVIVQCWQKYAFNCLLLCQFWRINCALEYD